MKKLLLMTLLFCASFGMAQSTLVSSQLLNGASGATALPSLNEQTFNVGLHTITWIASGTVSTCTVQLETSALGVSFVLATNEVAQTCTSSGTHVIYVAPANFVRLNVTALSGSGNVTFIYSGAVNTPVSTVASVVYSAGSYTNATTTFSSIVGLAFNIAAGQNLHAICRVTWQGSAGTTGPKYQFTGPAAPTAVALGMNSIVTATTVIAASATAFATPVANSGTVTTATNFTDTVSLDVINGTTAGTIQFQAAANGAGTLTVANGSSCAYN